VCSNDTPTNLQVARRTLGWKQDTASWPLRVGKAAIDIAHTRPRPDLILLECHDAGHGRNTEGLPRDIKEDAATNKDIVIIVPSQRWDESLPTKSAGLEMGGRRPDYIMRTPIYRRMKSCPRCNRTSVSAAARHARYVLSRDSLDRETLVACGRNAAE
jgi:hypothetical protein